MNRKDRILSSVLFGLAFGTVLMAIVIAFNPWLF